MEQINRAQIIHIPKVLYHWRIHSQSTASGVETKPYAILAAERAIDQHLQRTGVNGKISVLTHGYRIDYALPEHPPLLSIIIPTRDRADLLDKCINSILKLTTYKHYEIIIVNNGSVEEKTLTLLDKYISRGIKVIHDNSPFNYSRLNNTAVSYAQGEVLCLMNNDIEILTPNWIEQMITLALRPNTGCVGALLWYPNYTIQHAGVILGIGSNTEQAGAIGHAHRGLPKGEYGYFGRAMLCQEFSAVTGACLMVKKSIYQQVNGLDEQLAITFNDIDFCLRVRTAGYYNVFTPYAEMIHHESASRGIDDTPEKQKRAASEMAFMRQRWGNDLLTDPAYNPNLSFMHSGFSLAWPPRTHPL